MSTKLVCNVCNQPSSDLKQCSGCRSVFYCGKDHQKEDWSAHKKLCKSIQEAMKKGVVKYETLEEGDGENFPQKNNTVTVHYEGKLVDGTVFDSSFKRGEPFSFVLGKGEVIRGWDEGLKLLSKGEKTTLVLSPEYAYGEYGAPPSIPPNAVLIFTVKLIDMK